MWTAASFVREVLNAGGAPVATFHDFRLIGRHRLESIALPMFDTTRVLLPPSDDLGFLDSRVEAAWTSTVMDDATRRRLQPVVEGPFLKLLLCDLLWITVIEDAERTRRKERPRDRHDERSRAATEGAWQSSLATSREMALGIVGEHFDSVEEAAAKHGNVCDADVLERVMVDVVRRLGARLDKESAATLGAELAVGTATSPLRFPQDFAFGFTDAAPAAASKCFVKPEKQTLRDRLVELLCQPALADAPDGFLRRSRLLLESRIARWACLMQGSLRPRTASRKQLSSAFSVSQVLAKLVLTLVVDLRMTTLTWAASDDVALRSLAADADASSHPLVQRVYRLMTGAAVPVPQPPLAGAGDGGITSRNNASVTAPISPRNATTATLLSPVPGVSSHTGGGASRGGASSSKRSGQAAIRQQQFKLARDSMAHTMRSLFPKEARQFVPKEDPPPPKPPATLADQHFGLRRPAAINLAGMSGAMETAGVKSVAAPKYLRVSPRGDDAGARRRAAIVGHAKNSARRAEDVHRRRDAAPGSAEDVTSAQGATERAVESLKKLGIIVGAPKPPAVAKAAASGTDADGRPVVPRRPATATTQRNGAMARFAKDNVDLAAKEQVAVRLARDKMQEATRRAEAAADDTADALNAVLDAIDVDSGDTKAQLRDAARDLVDVQNRCERLMGSRHADTSRLLAIHEAAANKLTRLRRRVRFARLEGIV